MSFARKPITRSMKHYCEVAPQVDFLAELRARKLDFQGPDLKLLPIDSKEVQLPKMSQGEFEELGEQVIGAIQQIMKRDFQMQELWLPETAKPTEPKCNVFVSKDFFTNTERCLILIQGTGSVRAG